MRLAVCVSGLNRIRSNTLLERIIKPFSADVFIHTWDDPAGLDVFCPQLLQCDKQIDFTPISKMREGRFGHGWSAFASVSMFYSIKAANDLKCQYEQAHGFLYDYVVRTRADLEISNFPNSVDGWMKDELHVPVWSEPAPPFYTDLLWVTGSESSNLVCGLIDLYDEIIDDRLSKVQYTCNEELLYHYNANRVPPQWHEDIRCKIIR